MWSHIGARHFRGGLHIHHDLANVVHARAYECIVHDLYRQVDELLLALGHLCAWRNGWDTHLCRRSSSPHICTCNFNLIWLAKIMAFRSINGRNSRHMSNIFDCLDDDVYYALFTCDHIFEIRVKLNSYIIIV